MNLSTPNPLKSNSLDESRFHQLADKTLDALLASLEEADEKAILDVEYAHGVMTLRLLSGQQYIVNKHTASRQIWLSSPVSGGLHFSYDGDWKLPDGRTIKNVLFAELEAATGEVFS